MNNKVTILNVDILNVSMKKLLEEFRVGILFPVNVDLLVKLQKDRAFFNAYKNATHVVNDSRILFFLARFTGSPFVETISGSDFLPAYYQYHRNNNNIKIFLLGSKDGIALQAMQRINESVGRNIVVGAHSPTLEFDKNEDECNNIIAIVNKSNANVLVVGVGAPKQEKWIFKYHPALPNIKTFMAVGASIDIEAGVVKRAPRWVRQVGMEWLYRMYKEPKRLLRRYLIEDMVFFWLIFKERMEMYRSPWE